MRKLHRALAVLFGPFLAVSAVTGLLWAYAPYLYLKTPPGGAKKPIVLEDASRLRLTPMDAIGAVEAAGEDVKVGAVTLRFQDNRLVYSIAAGPKEFLVDAEDGKYMGKAPAKYPEFHAWVMKLHRFEFFGTKKELTIFSGFGLLAMLFTGCFLFRFGFKK